MKLLICGSRSISDHESIFAELDKLVEKTDIIIHGGAIGVDSIAGMYCHQKGIKEIIIRPVLPYRVENYRYRDCEMVGMADKVIAFWDGKSKGTIFTVNYARKRGKDVRMFNHGDGIL